MIVIAAHKPYWFPEDPAYLPVQVGFGEGLGIARDNTGDNIAEKNASYCELTALYWAWKNLDAPYLGLAHYRRHFAQPGQRGDKARRILPEKSLMALLEKYDILLPASRQYWIETNASHYAHAHHEKDLRLLRAVIAERQPAYAQAFDTVMRRTWGHRFNMFVMTWSLADQYCAWLFDILFAVEGRLDTTGYSAYDQRVYGFLAERLLDVWLLKEGKAYKALPCVYMEEINWLKKGGDFLRRKVGNGNGVQ